MTVHILPDGSISVRLTGFTHDNIITPAALIRAAAARSLRHVAHP